ncbi:MAG TPA: hypothetical protein VMC42_03190 [Methanoregulaceae archaeon]|nr:hypothetical protein [Methanoregulaceae archaeon]
MIRIVLMVIGVAFCIMSSLTAPAHASSLMAVSGDTTPGLLAGGASPDYPDTITIDPLKPGGISPFSMGLCSPGLCSPGNG